MVSKIRIIKKTIENNSGKRNGIINWKFGLQCIGKNNLEKMHKWVDIFHGTKQYTNGHNK